MLHIEKQFVATSLTIISHSWSATKAFTNVSISRETTTTTHTVSYFNDSYVTIMASLSPDS